MKRDGELDELDLAIVKYLQRNARLPNKKLAERVGLAPSTCLERVRRLLECGVLTGFRAEVDPRAMGIGLQAMIAVSLRRHSRDLVEGFREHALSRPEVLAVYHVAGATDFLLHVVAEDADHLRDLAMDAFTTRPEVGRLETHLIFQCATCRELPNYISRGSQD